MLLSLHTANKNTTPKLAGSLSYFATEKSDYSLMANEENVEGKKTTAIVARNIRRLLTQRKDNKLPHTQEWLAGQVGMSTPYLSQILGGIRVITTKYINLIAQALGCTPPDLMATEDDPVSNMVQDLRSLHPTYLESMKKQLAMHKALQEAEDVGKNKNGKP